MNVKRSVAGLTLVGSGLVGGLYLAPALVGAQDEPPAEEQRDEEREEPGGPCPGPHHGPPLEALRGPAPEVAAEAIGIEVDALREAVAGGQTIAEVAAANGVDPQAVVDALVADATARIEEKVADGELTQEEADERKGKLPERITALVNGERPAGGPRGGPPEGVPRDGDTPEGEPEGEEEPPAEGQGS